MVVGGLGEIVFQVSHKTVETLNNFKWSGSARWAIHQRHATHALTEYTGMDPDKITFDIYLSAFLGVSPIDELAKLWKYEREGTPVGLAIGSHGYGKYRWVVQNHSTSAETYDRDGNISSCTVSVELLEYLKN